MLISLWRSINKSFKRWVPSSLTDVCAAASPKPSSVTLRLKESFTEENATARDRALAHRLVGIATPAAAPEQTIVRDALDESFMATLATLYVSCKNDEGDVSENTLGGTGEAAAESSTSTASRQKPLTGTYPQCIACDLTKPLLDIFQTPCGHHYCQECLRALFKLSTTDETLFPPRCCRQEIPLPSVKLYLSSALIDLFEKKSIEFKTSDWTYCSQPTCSSFITSVNISGDRATCTACGTHTCTICKNTAHDGVNVLISAPQSWGYTNRYK